MRFILGKDIDFVNKFGCGLPWEDNDIDDVWNKLENKENSAKSFGPRHMDLGKLDWITYQHWVIRHNNFALFWKTRDIIETIRIDLNKLNQEEKELSKIIISNTEEFNIYELAMNIVILNSNRTITLKGKEGDIYIDIDDNNVMTITTDMLMLTFMKEDK